MNNNSICSFDRFNHMIPDAESPIPGTPNLVNLKPGTLASDANNYTE